ncbi:hypothetical protein [Flavobacterium sp. 22076]|jgi:hypothetical protein|uniref:hypothetical protein n=1 Tax=unclassified Flavobacterium TaxID=196869 RepID=UPI003F87516A
MEIKKIRERIANEGDFSDAEKYLVLLDDTTNYVLREGKFGIKKNTIHTLDHYFFLKNKLQKVNIPECLKSKINEADLIGIENCRKFYQFHRNIGVVTVLAGIICYLPFGFPISMTIFIIGIIQIYVIVEYYKNAKQKFNFKN